jgi:hypothetical protein
MSMECTLLCSAGLSLRYNGQTLLIDALNGAWAPYREIAEADASDILEGKNGYEHVCGLLFTHLHPDHYSESRTAEFTRRHPGVKTFLPREDDPEKISFDAGPFHVECTAFVHTPIPYNLVRHYVLLISAGETSVYVTADAAPDCGRHRRILDGRQADAGFWNGQYLSYPETRALMAQCARKNYIYHLPDDPRNGVRRKCERNFERFPQELSTAAPLYSYPSFLTI